LLAQVEDFLALRRGLPVGADGVGLSVDRLSAQPVLVGAAGDGAVVTEEGGGGAGATLAKG